jgi:hypothetical protein
METLMVRPKDMKDLDGYLTMCLLSIVNLESLEQYHIQAVNLGILPADQECLANSIIWDLRRLQRMAKEQAEGLLDLLPHDYDVLTALQKVKEAHVAGIKGLKRKRNEK